jgi:hypothetical protein
MSKRTGSFVKLTQFSASMNRDRLQRGEVRPGTAGAGIQNDVFRQHNLVTCTYPEVLTIASVQTGVGNDDLRVGAIEQVVVERCLRFRNHFADATHHGRKID